MLWWILQQGTEYFVVESENPPDLAVPTGERRKALLGFQRTKDEAVAYAKRRATDYNGTYRQ